MPFFWSDDVLALNDACVVKARLMTMGENGISRELVVLERDGSDRDWHMHKVMSRRRLSEGDELHVGGATIRAEKILGAGLAEVKNTYGFLGLAEPYGYERAASFLAYMIR